MKAFRSGLIFYASILGALRKFPNRRQDAKHNTFDFQIFASLRFCSAKEQTGKDGQEIQRKPDSGIMLQSVYDQFENRVFRFGSDSHKVQSWGKMLNAD